MVGLLLHDDFAAHRFLRAAEVFSLRRVSKSSNDRVSRWLAQHPWHVVHCKDIDPPTHLWLSHLCAVKANIRSVTTEVRALFVWFWCSVFLTICFLFQIQHSTSFVQILRPACYALQRHRSPDAFVVSHLCFANTNIRPVTAEVHTLFVWFWCSVFFSRSFSLSY